MSLRNILVNKSQSLNVLLGGYADETFSARAYRCEVMKGSKFWGVVRRVIDWFFRHEPNHCRVAYFDEKAKTRSPSDYK